MTARPMGDGEDDLVVHTESVPIAKARAMSAHLAGRPVGDSDGQDGLRAAMIATLLAHWDCKPDDIDATEAAVEEVADLLPVVTAWAEQRARERAAEELRAAADYMDTDEALTAVLRTRADALAAADIRRALDGDGS